MQPTTQTQSVSQIKNKSLQQLLIFSIAVNKKTIATININNNNNNFNHVIIFLKLYISTLLATIFTLYYMKYTLDL